uniref:START domain-containing protein n=1 Tax=Philodina roseola TaxID=96448 RepID=B3G4N4_PHIRO|nr:unknown [Philodina roseola]
MATFDDATTLDRYIDEDLSLINNTTIWKEYKRGKQHKDDVCYVYQSTNDSIWWIKLVALVEEGSIDNIDDLLDHNLKERHPEWHELYIDGRILKKNEDGHQLNVFFSSSRYASPSIFIAPRDTCYLKVRRNLSNGFILSYRSIDLPEGRDESGKFVRTIFKGAHLIEKTEKNTGFRYTYIQHADPGGSIPKILANRPQCDIIFKEIEGIRRAMKNSIQKN